MNRKIIKADGVGYHNAVPEEIVQTVTITRTIRTRPTDEAGNPLPPKVDVNIDVSDNITPYELVLACTVAIDNAMNAIVQIDRKRAEAFEHMARGKQGLPRLLQ